MMSSRLAATLALLGTLALGVLVGVLGSGALRGERRPPPPREGQGRPPGGRFADAVRQVVEPRDEAQWEALLPVVSATDERNRSTVDSAQQRLARNLEAMAQQLDSLLDDDQRARLREFAERMRSAPGVPGLPGRGPPPGRGGPSGRGGPPPP